ncbi:MAG: OmpH family outer membrane protein [Paludibacteraceae bacterium]|jgi:outer membrane protein|nr:OmpH family outer membrane protein [Paludibacteraceae bacterium]
MKNFNTIALAILALAVVGLYLLHFTGKGEKQVGVESSTFVADSAIVETPVDSLSNSFPVAYINVDSFLLNYEYAKKLNETLLKKQEKSRKELVSAQQKLQAELEVFQQKYQAGGFLSKESFEQEQNRLFKKDQELQTLEQRLAQDLITEQQKMNMRLRDSINSFFEFFNADKRYKLILSNTDADNILYAEPMLNITSEVVFVMNQRYRASQQK